MEIHFGRLLGDGIPFGVLVALNFNLIDISQFTFLEKGMINFPILSNIIWLIIGLVFLLFDNFVMGGPWSGIIFAIVTTLVLQNWMLGVIAGLLNFLLTSLFRFMAPS